MAGAPPFATSPWGSDAGNAGDASCTGTRGLPNWAWGWGSILEGQLPCPDPGGLPTDQPQTGQPLSLARRAAFGGPACCTVPTACREVANFPALRLLRKRPACWWVTPPTPS